LFSEEQQMDLIFLKKIVLKMKNVLKKNSFKDEECMQLYPLQAMQCH
jgi:hypothetical protein